MTYHNMLKTEGASSLPQKELCVIHPLVDEVCSNGLRVVWEVHVVQSVYEQHWIVVKSSDGHLKAHGSQFTGFHPSHQTLQHYLHKQRDALQWGNTDKSGLYKSLFLGNTLQFCIWFVHTLFKMLSYKQCAQQSHPTDLPTM